MKSKVLGVISDKLKFLAANCGGYIISSFFSSYDRSIWNNLRQNTISERVRSYTNESKLSYGVYRLKDKFQAELTPILPTLGEDSPDHILRCLLWAGLSFDEKIITRDDEFPSDQLFVLTIGTEGFQCQLDSFSTPFHSSYYPVLTTYFRSERLRKLGFRCIVPSVFYRKRVQIAVDELYQEVRMLNNGGLIDLRSTDTADDIVYCEAKYRDFSKILTIDSYLMLFPSILGHISQECQSSPEEGEFRFWDSNLHYFMEDKIEILSYFLELPEGRWPHSKTPLHASPMEYPGADRELTGQEKVELDTKIMGLRIKRPKGWKLGVW